MGFFPELKIILDKEVGLPLCPLGTNGFKHYKAESISGRNVWLTSLNSIRHL